MSKYQPLWEYLHHCGKAVIALSFGQIAAVAGVPLDHSFLRYKSELTNYGYEVSRISMKSQTVTFTSTAICPLVVYVHGKGGTASEAAHYKPLFPSCTVIGLDYRAETPWKANEELAPAFQTAVADHNHVILIANSIGAYFSMISLPQEKIQRSYFISPIVDMAKLINGMMALANVSENELHEQGTVKTAFGETLSWDYLCYVRNHPVDWNVPTEILYGGQDNLTDRETITAFANCHGANLTVTENGEHWFHTPEQLQVLDEWIMHCENQKSGVINQ